ncbi:BREX-1 system adenine-specific DNA-methyltransferase PglX, partial [Fusobacterium pseudoperiodonticum]|uniref:BREX-1 system adenine-specific DNA-methyltransferase PglX n=1 Tax=Fusobacterium pseudoperiodonticum TaxID=2663009 RepID=UPI0028ED78B3
LFTPDWIVKYMVENSLGKLALESTGINENLKNNWKYYIESELDKNSEKIKIEDVKILDPAMGSGHILVYTFDLLFEMYENLGWSTKDSVLSILKNNLYGLEIDERAGQLASFALMMKAREKFSRLFSVLKREEAFKLNTLIIEESNNLSEKIKNKIKDNNLNNLNKVIEDFEDAKEYGSILNLKAIYKETLEKEFNLLKESLDNEQGTLIFNEDELDINIEEDLELIESLIVQHIALTNQYEAVVTNPPYMGGKGFSTKLKAYTEKNYKDSKSDLFAVFIERCNDFTKKDYYTSMITMQSWMFLSSFEALRKNLIEKTEIKSLNHLGTRAFSEIGGEVVSTVAWVSKKKSPEKDGTYLRLVDYNKAELKEEEFFNKANYFQAKQKDFEKIPGSPIAYWVSDKIREIFEKNQKLGDIGKTRQGVATGNNEKFLRLWQEVNIKEIGFQYENTESIWKDKKKYVIYNKGGEVRKWYGNQDNLIKFDEKNYNLLKNSGNKLPSKEYYFKESISWSKVSSTNFSMRFYQKGFIFADAGMSYFSKENLKYILGISNSKLINKFLAVLSPTLNFEAGHLALIPLIYNDNKKIIELIEENISISKEEWDSRETSWDFEKLSLIDGKDLKSAYENYCSHWRDNFVQLHKNEEELNRLFIEIYELQDEMDEKVSFDDITILKKEAKIVEIDNSKAREFSSESERYLYDRGVNLEFNKDELVKQFLSYAIGCIMGRYSTNKPELIMANSDDVLELSSNKFLVKDANGDIRQEVKTEFLPDEFGILPITAEKDFSNDIVERVKEFVKFVYGEESLKDNLNFIAEALGNKDNRNPEEILRTYFITAFYKDHLQRYQNRPIYWLMNSGKKNAFSCLFYTHRYEPLTVARVRADYLIHYQEMLENKRKFIERQLYAEDITAKEKKNVEKELKDLDVLLKELREYANEVKHIAEQKIALDLDDGVNVNYERLGAILKKR